MEGSLFNLLENDITVGTIYDIVSTAIFFLTACYLFTQPRKQPYRTILLSSLILRLLLNALSVGATFLQQETSLFKMIEYVQLLCLPQTFVTLYAARRYRKTMSREPFHPFLCISLVYWFSILEVVVLVLTLMRFVHPLIENDMATVGTFYDIVSTAIFFLTACYLFTQPRKQPYRTILLSSLILRLLLNALSVGATFLQQETSLFKMIEYVQLLCLPQTFVTLYAARRYRKTMSREPFHPFLCISLVYWFSILEVVVLVLVLMRFVLSLFLLLGRISIA